MRVTAIDNLALLQGMRPTAAVTADSELIYEEAKKFMGVQSTEAQKVKENDKGDYMVVYMPHFKHPVIALIVLVWLIAAVLLGAAIALPILIGRRLVDMFAAHYAYNVYAVIGGLYLLWACYLSARQSIAWLSAASRPR